MNPDYLLCLECESPCYVFENVTLGDNQFEFTKDNRKTRFIGTPMLTRGNTCRVYPHKGGLQVAMTNYYANWAGVGTTLTYPAM